MSITKRVIYTVIVNKYDQLIEPAVYPGWDYVCFCDNASLTLRARLGLSKWDIRSFDDEGLDAFRYSRLPKILPHRYLPDYEYSAYIDGYGRFLKDPVDLLDTMGWPDYAVGEHRFRDTVFEEIEECIRKKNAPLEILENQRDYYLAEGLPGDTKLLENGLLLRRHNEPAVIALDEAWWEQIIQHSHRDQLSLPYAAWKQGFEIHQYDQALKHSFFTTRAHYRSMLSRWKRSFLKRLGQV